MKSNIGRAISIVIAVAFIFPSSLIILPISQPCSALATTTIMFNTGSNNSTMTEVIADTYTTWAFPASSFFDYVNFPIVIDAESYYAFSIWVGDLGADQGVPSRLMFKLGDTGQIIGNKIFNTTASGNPTSFAGQDQVIEIGKARLTPGTYNLQAINMMNEAVASENYIGIRISSIALETLYLYAKRLSFAIITDIHYMLNDTNTMGAVDGNTILFGQSPELGRAFIDQINNMTSTPDFVVILGDLMNNVAPAYYLLQKGDFDNLTMPYYPILGNHDHSDPAQLTAVAGCYNSTFPEFDTQFYYYRDISSQFRLIFLDTGACDGDGHFDEMNSISVAQKSWLNASLNTELPVFVFLHAPLLPSLSWDWLGEYSAINQILQTRGNVVSVFQGHGHNEWIRQSSNMIYVEAPSILQYPFTYTLFEYYGGTRIDVNRIQLNNATYMPSDIYLSNNNTNTSKGLGETSDIQFMGFGAATDQPLAVLMGVGYAKLLLTFLALGVFVGVAMPVIRLAEGKKPLREQDLTVFAIRMMIYIVIGCAMIGIVYSMLWSI